MDAGDPSLLDPDGSTSDIGHFGGPDSRLVDGDGDGVYAFEDCDDADSSATTGSAETCNRQDDDCDGWIDEDVTGQPTWYADSDGDGFGDSSTSVQACTAPSGYVADDTDCDDSSSAVHPSASEICDGMDNDCDGDIDDDDASVSGRTIWYADSDSDTYGDASVSVVACDRPASYVADDSDCDGSDSAISPAATEVCDGDDNDCDGTTDEADATDASTWFADTDRDGFGDASTPTPACTQPTGYVSDHTDCDDTSATTYPGATEVAGDEVDQDCDGTEVCLVDVDGDGYRPDGTTEVASADVDCTGSGEASASTPGGDCDDANGAINPGATEVVGDEVDQDCDGSEDCYVDGDGDGVRLDTVVASVDADCRDAGEALASAAGLDCDDTDPDAWPGAPEVLGDEVDQDCDRAEACFADGDGDGVRTQVAVGSTDLDCQDAGEALASAPAGDCDDTDDSVHPGAEEGVADGVDQDCDGIELCYADRDGDGYRPDSSSTVESDDLACEAVGEADATVPTGDCDDLDPGVNPGAEDIPEDGIDQDCVGGDASDEGGDDGGGDDGGSDDGGVADGDPDGKGSSGGCFTAGDRGSSAPFGLLLALGGLVALGRPRRPRRP